MASNVTVRLKLRGLNALMTSRSVTSDVIKRAQAIQNAAGENFEVNVVPHKYTARAFIRPKNYEGAVQEAREKRLLRAIDAAR